MEVKPGHRGRMRDHCVALHKLFMERERIAVSEIMKELRVSEDTVRRWVDTFSCVMDLRIENAVVIVNHGNEKLHAK